MALQRLRPSLEDGVLKRGNPFIRQGRTVGAVLLFFVQGGGSGAEDSGGCGAAEVGSETDFAGMRRRQPLLGSELAKRPYS